MFSVRIALGDLAGGPFTELAAVVDTGASYSMAPAALLRALGVEPYRDVRFVLADGSRTSLPVGYARVRVEGREEMTQVVFVDPGRPILLGATTLQQLGLAVDSVNERLVPTDALLFAAIRGLSAGVPQHI